jgi:3-hydroxyisobutyrate dehydrogenase-like beta-hydroxyacid dehydrogenase
MAPFRLAGDPVSCPINRIGRMSTSIASNLRTLPAAHRGLLGLGVMGTPWPATWHRPGTASRSTTARPRKAEALAPSCRQPARPTPALAAAGADFVFCCVGNDDDLRGVLGETAPLPA